MKKNMKKNEEIKKEKLELNNTQSLKNLNNNNVKISDSLMSTIKKSELMRLERIQ